MEDNRPNQDLTNQDIEFIKEKVKERPLNRRKLFKRTLLTASMAAIFGLIACVTFLVLEPVFSNLLYPEEEPQQVELKEENIEDEMRPEDMILEEETETETTTELQTVVEKVALEIGDYQKLYRNMYAVAKTFADHSMVTVTGVVSDVDWFDNTYENQGQTAGLIVADNGKELLILVDDAAIRQAVAEHNRICELIRAIGEFRKGDKPRITGYEFQVITLATYVAPKYLLIDKLEETLEELKTRA